MNGAAVHLAALFLWITAAVIWLRHLLWLRCQRNHARAELRAVRHDLEEILVGTNELPRVSLVSPWGDLVCPACGTNIMTPDGMELVAGPGTCPRCRQPFAVSEKVAAKANELAEMERQRP
jgi:hypothetical protein